jgi:CheY-like chemotaxis protein
MGTLISLIMRIFVIDDDETTTNLLSKFLNGMGFETIVTNDPMEGLKKIRREKFDVILLDINMPVVSGYGVLEMLAVSDILKDQNIFIFSGTQIPKIQLKNLLRRDGVNGFLEKPIDLEKLVNVIAN